MQHESKQVRPGASSSQRGIVLAVLERDAVSKAALSAELNDLDADTIANALAMLVREGVVVVDGERVGASRCARHLDALSLICV
jgi:hypothetical protein